MNTGYFGYFCCWWWWVSQSIKPNGWKQQELGNKNRQNNPVSNPSTKTNKQVQMAHLGFCKSPKPSSRGTTSTSRSKLQSGCSEVFSAQQLPHFSSGHKFWPEPFHSFYCSGRFGTAPVWFFIYQKGPEVSEREEYQTVRTGTIPVFTD